MDNKLNMGFPGGSDGKESVCNVGDLGSISGSGRLLPWRRNLQPTPVFSLGESHGQRNLADHGVARVGRD